MSDFTKLVDITNSKEVLDGLALPKTKLHRWLVLGQTEYICENGTLSDGHEKFTDAQKYAQALKELYYTSVSMQEQEAQLMLAQADLLDALDLVPGASLDSDKLRVNAKIKMAQTRILTIATNIEDQSRVVRFYHKRVRELGPIVESQYPGGIETAELDNWETVAAYRLEKEKTPGLARERMDHLPLPADRKAMIGYASGRNDAIATLMVTDPTKCEAMGQAVQRLIESKQTEKEAN